MGCYPWSWSRKRTMVIQVNPAILSQYGPTTAVLHGYLKAKTAHGVLIGGVKCSPINIDTMGKDMGGLARNTIYTHLDILSKDGYIVSSSKRLHNPIQCKPGVKLQTAALYVYFGVVKG